jgi:hypothetical protein
LGDGPYQVLFGSKGIDPINKRIRLGAIEYTVIGVMDKRPSLGSLDTGAGQSRDHPLHRRTRSSSTSTSRDPCATAIPSAASSESCRAMTPPKGQALAEVEEIMRIRHGLKLDEPNDFDIITQDALLRTWEQISRACCWRWLLFHRLR